VRKASAAFKAASAQYCAAGATCHTLDKAMHSRTVALLWLIRSFWHTTFTLPHIRQMNN